MPGTTRPKFQPRHAIILFFVVFLVAVVIGHFTSGSSDAPGSIESAMLEDREEPTVTSYPLLDGNAEWKLSDYKGKVVVVNLWATWCPPCVAETPALVRIANELEPKGLAMVGVTMDDHADMDKVRAFRREYKMTYPIAVGTDEPSYSLGIPLPTTMVYDRSGKLAAREVGMIDEKAFRKLLESLLAEPALQPATASSAD